MITLLTLTIVIATVEYSDIDVTSQDIEGYLKDEYKDNYYEIYDFDYLKIGSTKFVFIKNKFKEKLPKFNGDCSDVFMKCFDETEKFVYVENQPNPNKLKDEGGNCHAFAIYFKKLCEFNELDCEIIPKSKNHLINKVTIDGDVYLVDTVNRSISKEEN